VGLHKALRLLYYVGLPFAALLFGRDAVTARFLGLQPFEIPTAGQANASDIISQNWLNWARDAGWAVGAGAALFAFTLVARGAYRRALAAADFRETHTTDPEPVWAHLREAAYLEVHWAFYRNAPLIALRSDAGSPYWGTWIGLGVVAIEAVLDPAWRQTLSIPERASENLGRVSLAVLSAVLFWKTQNLWLAIALHFVISWALAAIARAATPSGE
jgi:hypothetical protein